MDYSKHTGRPLVLGILSVVLSLLYLPAPIAFVLGIIGTITGYKAREVSGKSGFVLSLIGLIASSLILLTFVCNLSGLHTCFNSFRYF